MSFALSQHAHIRIEILLDKTAALGRALDTIALMALTIVATLVTIKSWPVIEKRLLGSTANTPSRRRFGGYRVLGFWLGLVSVSCCLFHLLCCPLSSKAMG